MAHALPRPVLRLLASALAALLTVLVLAPVPASAADFETAVNIARTSPATQESGKPFVYTLDVNCDALSPDPAAGTQCADATLTIGLDGLADEFDDAALLAMIALDNLPAGATFDVVDGELVIDLGALEAGDSARYQLTITPPNFVTPDGTTWDLAPELSGSNFDTQTDDPVTSTATATLDHSISKTLQGSAFRNPGDTVTYDLVVACRQRATGTIGAATMTVDDVLPAGLTYVSASPAPTTGGVGDTNHTWDLSTLPTSCTSEGANGSTTITVTATVDAGVASGTALVNRAGVTSTTTDGQDVAPETDTASVTVVDGAQPGPGTFAKRSFGQLRDRDADPSSSNTGQEIESHTTFRGNWLGYRTTQPRDVLDNDRPNQNTSMRQSGYVMEHDSGIDQGAGWSAVVQDPVPCTDGEVTGDADKLYESKAPSSSTPLPSELCQAPAFHVKTVSVYSSATGVVADFDAAAYTPQAVYADGTIVDMVRVDATNGGREGSYALPDLAREDVAEIRFPKDDGLSGQVLRWAVFGYTDSSVEVDSVVRNTAHADVYWKAETSPSYSPSHSAELYVVDAPQIGIEKDLGNHTSGYTTSLRLTARLLSPGEPTQDLVVTDLLPEGMTLQGSPTVSAVTVAHAAPDGTSTSSTVPVAAGDVEVVDNFRATGRQLLRVTVPRESLAPFGASKSELTITGTVAYPREPGAISNTAQVFHGATALLPTCQQSPAYAQESSDPSDLDGNGSTADRSCYARDSLTVPPPSGGANFKVTKTVQGDKDLAPKSYPGIGVISKTGGTAVFGVGWKNTGSSPLESSVVYDLFPRVGDTGVGGSVAGKPRNSRFDAVLVDVTSTDGVTVEYTTSANPCRPEVYPDDENTGCDDAAWTTTAPTTAAEREAVTGVRLSRSGPFVPGAGWHVDIAMTVPDTVADDEIAWNSVAGAAKVVGGDALNPNSPPKVGISANENQPLLIAKELDGEPTRVRPGDQLTYDLSVANPNVTAKPMTGATDTLPDGLELVSISPAGPTYDAASHTITFPTRTVESGQTLSWTVVTRVRPGTSGAVGNVFTVPGGGSTTNICPDDPDTPEDESKDECVEVAVEPARLTIDKTVTGGAAAWAQYPLTLEVACVVGTEEVDLPGDGVVTITADDVTDGSASKTIEVPFGSTCTVSEPGDGGATEDPEIDPATVTIDPDDADGAFTVDVTNTFEAGGLRIEKAVEGVGSQFQGGTFGFDVACTYDPDPAGDPRTVFAADDVTVPVEDGETSGRSTVLADDLPIGTSCTVTETDAGAADDLADPVTVTIARDAESGNVTTALVTNAYSAGTIAVAKTVEGEWAETGAVDDVEFEVLVRCQLDAGDGPADVWSGPVTVSGGATTTVRDDAGDPVLLPVGTVCFAPEETEDGGATSVDIDPDTYETGLEVTGGSPQELQALTIDVTNTFDAGSLAVVKELTGVGSSLGSGTYAFAVVCTFEGEPVLSREDVEVEVVDGETVGRSQTLEPLPVGAECTVTETDAGLADAVADPQTVTIGADGQDDVAAAVMVNSYSAGVLSLEKVLDGAYGDHPLVRDREFELEVTCELAREGELIDSFVDRVSITADQPVMLADDQGGPVLLPVGTSCWAEETDANGADASVVDHDSLETALQVVAGRPDELQDLTVTATNTFDTDPEVESESGSRGDGLGLGLPDTGGPVLWLALAGALAVGLGVALRRRRG